MTTKTVQVRHRLLARNVAAILAFEVAERGTPLPTNIASAEALIREHLFKWGSSQFISAPVTVDARVCVSFLYPELAAHAPRFTP